MYNRFYFIRHGESEANMEQKVAGAGDDTTLTDRGKQQIKDVEKIIYELDFHKIYHSPLIRT